MKGLVETLSDPLDRSVTDVSPVETMSLKPAIGWLRDARIQTTIR